MTPEQLKGKIRNYSAKFGIPSQEILQMYLFERILERLSVSKYSKKFILKGGLLISSMLGISERSTMDMDTTVTGINMDENTVVSIFKEILAIDLDDSIKFEFKKIEQIREEDDYFNFRIHFNAISGRINNPMKIDITTGDVITPQAVDYSYKKIFDNDTIPVMAYNIETILAEKYETIIRRNIASTRARDFYDIFKFFNIYKDKINKYTLQEAIRNTSRKRESLDDLDDAFEILNDIKTEQNLQKLWNNYVSNNKFAEGISFDNITDCLFELYNFLN